MFRPTPIDQLRQPHPEQERIDAESARLLREAVRRRLERIPYAPAPRTIQPKSSPKP